MHQAIETRRVAVITPSASEIGLAAARQSLHAILADLPANLDTAAQSLRTDCPNIKVLPIETNVSQF